MQVGGFGVTIVGSASVFKSELDGYVPLSHGEQYSIALENNTSDRVNLCVKVDGASVGKFQLPPNSSGTLERPADDNGRFTFFAAGTSEAQSSGEAMVGRQDKGLVEVTFVPERKRPPTNLLHQNYILPSRGYSDTLFPANMTGCVNDSYPYGAMRGGVTTQSCSKGLSAGITGMTGHSSQQFGTASHITEDASRTVVITLRLVARLSSLAAVRPLPARRGNPVPAAIG